MKQHECQRFIYEQNQITNKWYDKKFAAYFHLEFLYIFSDFQYIAIIATQYWKALDKKENWFATSQLTFASLNSKIETLEKGVKYVQS